MTNMSFTIKPTPTAAHRQLADEHIVQTLLRESQDRNHWRFGTLTMQEIDAIKGLLSASKRQTDNTELRELHRSMLTVLQDRTFRLEFAETRLRDMGVEI